MNRLAAVFVALLAPSVASAEWCGTSVGAAGGLSPAGRGWDLSTAGPVAWSATPLASAHCALDNDALWVGVETVPWLQHTYGGNGWRGPVLTTASLGTSFGTAAGSIGPYVFTNGPASGIGLRWASGNHDTRAPIELRLAWMGGRNPDFQASLAVQFASWEVGDEVGRPLRGDAPFGAHFAHGFELGNLNGYRAEVRWPHGTVVHGVGARVGVLHGRLSHTALQPTALGYVDLVLNDAMGLQVSGGATVRKGEVGPIAGVATTFRGEESPVGLQLGVLVGQQGNVYVSPDVSVLMVW